MSSVQRSPGKPRQTVHVLGAISSILVAVLAIQATRSMQRSAEQIQGRPHRDTEPPLPAGLPRAHAGTSADGPEEGLYDARRGATGYAPLVATFGALTLPALALVFTGEVPATQHELALTTGFLVIGLFGSLIGSFALAAIGAERDPTANISAAIMYAAIPVSSAALGTLASFEILASIYVSRSTLPFLAIVVAGSVYVVMITAMAIGDAPCLHPRTLSRTEFDEWRKSQWLKTRADAYVNMSLLFGAGLVVPAAVLAIKWAGFHIVLTTTMVNVVIYTGIVLALLGASASALRTTHPLKGNHQRGVRRGEAWAITLIVSLYASLVLLVLPTG